ncbi:Threonine/homoserine efflux transporter RhtA [Mucilaginibacter gossypiicola]|uniref:Threonine/homoserine efflux transporter RhtA n=1 Tax=Mucilaginibacter gossypiicola TaxID=551995 RepID=A0A1H8B7I1_9SPHI|nr:DMT family transporter [Mucilaginibacter gossypiicola]SEM78812.1 Threonine/homoserine efflux transporter RhtA [Mucilaginibacter gossypiicola]
MKSESLKGSLFVALGACCYGMLGSFVKMAYRDGFTTAEVVLSQFGLGLSGLFVLTLFSKQQATQEQRQPSSKSKIRLIIAGTSLGLTSFFYYMAVKLVPVSVAIVLLMQTVWMSVVLEMLVRRQLSDGRKIIAVLLVLCGTILATQLLKQSGTISWVGLGWGLLSALSYTATMYSSNHVGLQSPPLTRSFYMILGGFIIIVLIFHASINTSFSWRILLSWGILISLFGTILPPLLFTRGMPLTGMGLGAIIATLEIPVAVVTAYWLLHETTVLSQWVGIVLILAAVVLMNLKTLIHK